MAAQIHQFPCLSDNFGVLIHDPATGATASIDAPEAVAVMAALKEKGWTLTDILVTHHHADHTQGNLELKAASGCTIVGPAAEAGRIPDSPVWYSGPAFYSSFDSGSSFGDSLSTSVSSSTSSGSSGGGSSGGGGGGGGGGSW